MSCMSGETPKYSRDWSIPLLGEDGHFTEEAVFEEDKLVAAFTCNHCGSSMPHAGLGVAFWTRDVLLQHLLGCSEMPAELKSQISGVS